MIEMIQIPKKHNRICLPHLPSCYTWCRKNKWSTLIYALICPPATPLLSPKSLGSLEIMKIALFQTVSEHHCQHWRRQSGLWVSLSVVHHVQSQQVEVIRIPLNKVFLHPQHKTDLPNKKDEHVYHSYGYEATNLETSSDFLQPRNIELLSPPPCNMDRVI